MLSARKLNYFPCARKRYATPRRRSLREWSMHAVVDFCDVSIKHTLDSYWTCEGIIFCCGKSWSCEESFEGKNIKNFQGIQSVWFNHGININSKRLTTSLFFYCRQLTLSLYCWRCFNVHLSFTCKFEFYLFVLHWLRTFPLKVIYSKTSVQLFNFAMLLILDISVFV